MLIVGNPGKGYGYGGNSNLSFLHVDGTNPPLVAVLRFVDQHTGWIYTVGVYDGNFGILGEHSVPLISGGS